MVINGKDRTMRQIIKLERDMSDWACEKCGTVNHEYFPWPVNAECEKCGHAQMFGKAALEYANKQMEVQSCDK